MSKIGENGAINCTTMRTAALVGTESPGGSAARGGDSNSVPVIAPAPGDARKATRSATSRGWVGRPIEIPPGEAPSGPFARPRSPCRRFSPMRESRPRQQQLPLNRGDVDDDARAPLKHLRQQRPIQPHRWKQILVERPLPFGVIECRETPAGNGRTADDMNNDVNSASYSVTASTTAAQPSAVAISAATNKSSGASVSGRARADASTLAPPSRIAPLQLRRFPSCRPSRACASRQGRGRHASPDLQGADSVISRQAETVG